MSEENPLESLFAAALKQAGVPFEYQKPVGTGGGYCRSKFPCRCGEGRFNEDWGSWEEGWGEPGNADSNDCPWYTPEYTRYFIDFFLPVGRGIAVELDGSYHNQPEQRARDAERQGWIERNCGYKVVRLSSQDVFSASMNGTLVDWCKGFPDLVAEQMELVK